MSEERTLILDPQRMDRTIERMAWEVMERHMGENEVLIVGISNSGYKLAEKLHDAVQAQAKFNVTLGEISVNKRNPGKGPTVCKSEIGPSTAVVVVDDVLNTGGTLIYAVNHFLGQHARRITTAVLIDRNHKRFPIKADIKGLSLSTSLQETVEVVLDKDSAAYLI